MSYYKDELDLLRKSETQYPINLKFTSDKGATKWLSLNKDSIPVIINYLTDLLNKLEDTNGE